MPIGQLSDHLLPLLCKQVPALLAAMVVNNLVIPLYSQCIKQTDGTKFFSLPPIPNLINTPELEPCSFVVAPPFPHWPVAQTGLNSSSTGHAGSQSINEGKGILLRASITNHHFLLIHLKHNIDL